VHFLDPAVRHDDRVELLGDRASTSSMLVGRLNAVATDWRGGCAIYSGPMLASESLISSAAYRDELRRTHSRAIGADMEGHGLYAAATDAQVPWILVKAISDWGVDRDVHYEPDLAARNAAEFAVHALSVGAFDEVRPQRLTG
jgi:nucleoside phosphorylase